MYLLPAVCLLCSTLVNVQNTTTLPLNLLIGNQPFRLFRDQFFSSGYDLNRTCDEIRSSYGFDVTCQGSVPESIIAFLESSDYESAVRLAVSLGGDSDTMGAITGGIAEAYYGGVPENIKIEVLKRLPNEFIEVMQKFYQKFVDK